jgi:drug/metabolite transporter (DMT)-like permease
MMRCSQESNTRMMPRACRTVGGGLRVPGTITETGLSAHYCLTRALGAAEAVVVLPMEFARLPVVAVIGLLAYGEPLDPWLFLGAAVIVAGIWLNVAGGAGRRPGP